MKNKNLSDEIIRNIENCEENGGIDLSKLSIGTKIEVHTRNTIYNFEKVGELSEFKIKSNGRYFKKEKLINFPGSTFGGSMIKLYWIGNGMHMEFNLESGRVLTTSSVKSFKVIEK